MKITHKPSLRASIQKQRAPSAWQTLIETLTRPPRMSYNQCQLGYQNFKIKNRVFQRRDQVVIHNSNKKIFLSIYDPEQKVAKIIVYLHGNSSSKVEAQTLIPYLPPGFSMGSFDFIGCGKNRQQDFITLGFSESQQVQTVVNYLKSLRYTVYLWGRSMGAVSALLYGKVDIIVADSPFRSVRKLCKELSLSKRNPLPKCITSCLFPCVFLKLKSDVRKVGGYDLDHLNIEEAVKKINTKTTLIFLSGDEDDLIHHSNSERLYDIFLGSDKYIEIVKGTHNTQRPQPAIERIMKIIEQKSDINQLFQKQVSLQQIQITINL